MGLVPARDDDSIDQIGLLLRRVDELERLGASRWGKPSTVSWGLINRVQATANQATITTIVDLTSLSITWTGVAGRWYRIKGYARINQNTAGGSPEAVIADVANSQLESAWLSLSAGFQGTLTPEVILQVSGSATAKLRLFTNAGSVTLFASATTPAWLSVEDVGPV